MRRLLVLLCLLPAGCTAVLNFDQCNQASDCLALTADGGTPYCTADHICVAALPDDQLCKADPASSTDPNAVTIAGLFRLSGADGQKDTAISQAVSLAVSEINSASTARHLRLLQCDTNGDPMQARRALVRAVTADGAVAFIGPSSSSELVGLVNGGENLVTKYDVLVVSQSATSPSISSLPDGATSSQPGLIWRTCANDNLQAKELAKYVLMGSTAPTIITDAYIDTTYGSGLSSAFSGAVSSMAPTLIPTSKAFPEGTPGSTVASYLAMTPPQVSLIVADADAPAWLAALDPGDPSLAATKYLFTDGAKSGDLFSLTKSAALLNRVNGSAPYHSTGMSYTGFVGQYMGTYHADPDTTAFTENAYDAVYMVAIAMGATLPGSRVTGAFLATGMARLSDSAGASIDIGPTNFAEAYNVLANSGTVNLQGASGPIDFAGTTNLSAPIDFTTVTGDVVTAPIEIWGVNTAVDPPEFNTVSTGTP